MSLKNVFSAQCHCGNITCELETDKELVDFAPRRCSCSLCVSHGAAYISDPHGKAVVSIADKDQVSYYRFGHKTSDFIVCKRCGTLMIATCEINDQLRGVINITPWVDREFGPEVGTNFDAEQVNDRLARRAKTWTGTVELKFAE